MKVASTRPSARNAVSYGSWLAIASWLAMAACDGSAGREAQTLAQAVERYRRADNAQKAAMIVAISNAPCTAADVCAARETCLASANATAEALRLKNEVSASLADLEAGRLAKDSPEAQRLPAKLDEAETLLRDGFQRLTACDEQILNLKRTYRF